MISTDSGTNFCPSKISDMKEIGIRWKTALHNPKIKIAERWSQHTDPWTVEEAEAAIEEEESTTNLQPVAKTSSKTTKQSMQTKTTPQSTVTQEHVPTQEPSTSTGNIQPILTQTIIDQTQSPSSQQTSQQMEGLQKNVALPSKRKCTRKTAQKDSNPYICATCLLPDSDHKDTDLIGCDLCSEWSCISCTDAPSDKKKFWACSKCTTTMTEMRDLTAMISGLKKEL